MKFGAETLTSVTIARCRLTVRDRQGNRSEGWGETPLSVQWVWPSSFSYEDRHQALKDFTKDLCEAWGFHEDWGHPLEVGRRFIEGPLVNLQDAFNRGREEPLPHLAALVCCSLFDIALHDAYGNLHSVPIYSTYNAGFMNEDLSAFLEPATGSEVSFQGRHPSDFLVSKPPSSLPAWHLVGGMDPVTQGDLTGEEPEDGHPVILGDWIERDGLQCLKIKLRGNDFEWDFNRLVEVGEVSIRKEVDWLSADFNCTVTEPEYVNQILDRLRDEYPRIHGMLLYVEQPFPYDLERNRIDVHSVSARKPLFMDESAHDWRLVRLGRELGWTGVALKTCKTQTGALLSLCWAKAHGMTLMVQDLTNPMLAQIPHVQLAAHADTICGVETNAMQFYPEASSPEAKVHPGLYRRSDGRVDLSTLGQTGFGYRVDEIKRVLPPPVCAFGEIG
ncbi:MAG: mandelate racemase/muconate lactonizing enzyme family protein [Candidatus Omnitrophica bacterium]|nr:mandelate racemase/muconate lactonizing enzyme family protein [Candidatus Omnitrophota bacterium]